MPNGCMCCRVRGDLVDALKRLIVSANNAPGGDGAASSDATNAPDAGDTAAGASEVAASADSSGLGEAAKNIAATEEQAQGAVAVLDGIILECSGLDELAPVLQVFEVLIRSTAAVAQMQTLASSTAAGSQPFHY